MLLSPSDVSRKKELCTRVAIDKEDIMNFYYPYLINNVALHSYYFGSIAIDGFRVSVSGCLDTKQ